MKAVIYGRQSGGDSEESLSVDSQIDKCRELCEKNGWEIVGIFSDLNTSGRTYPVGAEEIARNDSAFQEWYRSQTKAKKFRAGLGKALDAEKDVLVVYDETRLMRPWADTFLESYVRQRLKGIRLYTVKEGEVRFDQFTGRLVNSITNQVEDNQLQTNKRKAKEALDRLKSQGYKAQGTAPYGYDYDKNTKSCYPNAHLFEVREAFRLFNSGLSLSMVCRRINAMEGVGRRWTMKLLRKTLRLPCYCGLMYYHGSLQHLKEGQMHELAVSEEEWHRAGSRLDERRQAPGQRKYAYSLTGLVFCGYCGSAMRIVFSKAFLGPDKPRGELLHSYWCPSGYFDERTKLDCSLARTRYSLHEPAELCERGFEPSYDGLVGRFNRSMICSTTFPELEIKGLYEGIMPLLYPIALRGLDDVPAVSEQDLTSMENELSEARRRHSELERLAMEGLLPYDKIASRLRDGRKRLRDLEARRQAMLDELSEHDKLRVQRNANRLMAIRKGVLHPQDWRELFLRDYDRLVLYASKVVLKRKDGRDIAIPKICCRSSVGLAPAILSCDGHVTTVTLLHKSAWKAIKCDEDGDSWLEAETRTLWSGENLVILEAGESPLPGDGSGNRVSERTKRRRELWLQEHAGWKDD